MAQDVPLMRQVEWLRFRKGVFGTLSLGVTEATGLAGSVVVQVVVALFGSPQSQRIPFLSRIDFRLKATRGVSCYRKLGAVLGKQPTCSLVRVWPRWAFLPLIFFAEPGR